MSWIFRRGSNVNNAAKASLESSSSSLSSSPSQSPSPSPSSSRSVKGPVRPIRVVYANVRERRFKMDPEAMAVLQLVKEPIGVVSVYGPAHQGKGYILNQILGRSSGFQVASTHRPCTKVLNSAIIREESL